MRLLLDTHLLLWSAGWQVPSGGSPLSAEAIAVIGNPDNDPFFSAASIWEVAIKFSLGRAGFDTDPHLFRRGLLDNGYQKLPITGEHAAAIGMLPLLHKDPFDRLLISQATIEGILLLPADNVVARYPGPIRAV